jgi:hypothetical protein
MAGLAGIRYVRFGLWKTLKVSSEFKGVVNKTEQSKIEGLRQGKFSNDNWVEVLKFASNNTNPYLFEPEENLPALYVGQKGPILISSGILCAFVSLLYFGCIKFKIPTITNGIVAWSAHLIGLTIQGSSWSHWHSLAAISFASPFLSPLLVCLLIIGLVQIWKGDFPKKWHYVLLILASTAIGLCTPFWEASSIIFMLTFVFQKGRSPLGPWTTAVAVLLISYHTILNISYHASTVEVFLGFFVSIAILMLVANKEPDPDHPRLSALTVGLGAVVVGCFLFAQYDKALTSALKSETENNARYRSEINKL